MKVSASKTATSPSPETLVVIKIEKMNNRLELSKLRIGDIIPDWSIELISDEILPKIDNFLGKPLLILFFSLGCPGCMGRAVPYANRVVYENGAKINVVGIHTNFEGIEVSLEKFKSAKEEHYFRFPFYKDYNYDTTFLNYGAGGTPHWVLADEKGIAVYSIFGSDPNNALLRLDYLINELILKI